MLPGRLLRTLRLARRDGLVERPVPVTGLCMVGALALPPRLDRETQADPGQQVLAELGDLRIVGGRADRPVERAVGGLLLAGCARAEVRVQRLAHRLQVLGASAPGRRR